jgi:hypothetical protein
MSGNSEDVNEVVRTSILQVCRWVEGHNYRAYDPGDGDLSFLRHLTTLGL